VSFLSGLGKGLGKLVKGAAGKAAGFIPGGSVAIEAAKGIAGKIAKRVGRKAVAVAAAGGVTAGVVGMRMAGAGGGGATAGMMQEGGYRTYRRMNPSNFRATRRAIRRVEYAARSYSKLFHVTHGKIKGAPNVKPRFRRKRAA
jgi:hypothetical protein